ncbi:hypothetical protein C725_1293 [Pacificimonas flava]|uniref:Uncharacterized protein n=1 Tax=Pacificimonas flava TaxID=1234595 RepID=M2U5V2_9SPHN|nr:hypothetical protein C725_1293 [Pacificimonas flava]
MPPSPRGRIRPPQVTLWQELCQRQELCQTLLSWSCSAGAEDLTRQKA